MSVTTDLAHNAIFEGYTESPTPGFPVFVGYQMLLKGGSDGYVAKFTAAGTQVWGTYFGGSAKDACRGGIVTNGANEIYVGGVTWSVDLPIVNWIGAFS